MTTATASLEAATQIRAELGRRHRSQAWLAEQIGMSAYKLSRRMCGGVSFSAEDLAAIARALEVPVATLLEEA
jgi:transcriptional regulator with XRE-family HTH domain